METMTTTHRLSRRVLIALVAAVAVAGVALGLVIANATDDDNGTVTLTSASQVASVQRACRQWLADPGQGGTSAWRTRMTSWMTQAMADAGTGPQMMWSSPDQLRSTCQRWAAANPPDGTGTAVDPQTWCDTMVTWMTSHMRNWTDQDDWNGWMRNGSMMGR